MFDVLPRCLLTERTVRSEVIVLEAPVFDFLSGIGQSQEPMLVQAFLAESGIEGFGKRIIRGLSRS